MQRENIKRPMPHHFVPVWLKRKKGKKLKCLSSGAFSGERHSVQVTLRFTLETTPALTQELDQIQETVISNLTGEVPTSILDAVQLYLISSFGNAASGQRADSVLDKRRTSILMKLYKLAE